MKKKSLIIGTRGSKLALWQAKWFQNEIQQNFPEIDVLLKIIKTRGDKMLDAPLSKIGGKGLFIKELEKAIFTGEIDVAVHSVKDIPTELPEGLGLLCFSKRENPADVLIAKQNILINNLPSTAILGTSSLRRKCQLLAYNPNFNFVEIRGNLDTRLRKLKEQNIDGIVVAAAGMLRLGFKNEITEFLPKDVFIPAVGQGVIAVEGKLERDDLTLMCSNIDNLESRIAVTSERAFLDELGGGCQVPIAANATIKGNYLSLVGFISDLTGKIIFKNTFSAPVKQAESLGKKLGIALKEAGGEEILKDILT